MSEQQSQTKPKPLGVRMPAWLYLNEFGRLVHQAFGVYPWLVGSALRTKQPADIDVRLVLRQSDYLTLIGPMTEFGKPGTRWASLSLAYSALGAHLTGKPIDFQIQTVAVSNVYTGESYLVLGDYDE